MTTSINDKINNYMPGKLTLLRKTRTSFVIVARISAFLPLQGGSLLKFII